MNFIFAVLAYFGFLATSVWAVAWLASQGKPGWGWIVLIIILSIGSVNISQKDSATCPKCGHYFKVDKTTEN